MENTYIDYLANELLNHENGELQSQIIVLPNKRARVFLIEALRKRIKSRVFLPQIISIDDLIGQLSGLRVIDPIELVFNFYDVYLEITPESEQQSFELFSGWAKVLIQDFNEIDRYLLKPSEIFEYLDAIDQINHWSVESENQTELVQNYLTFWKKLPGYYDALYKDLLGKKLAYQGMAYREAIKQLGTFISQLSDDTTYIFAGFNALNAAEEKLFQELLAHGNARIIWDADKYLLQNIHHDASLFMRRYKKIWPYYSNKEFSATFDHFSEHKNLHIIGTPKSIGQAKIAGQIIEEIQSKSPSSDLKRVAVVLGDENLLIPLLHALPDGNPLNITMSYPAKNTLPFILVSRLFKMHTNALTRNRSSYVYYYKDVIEILRHPLIEPYVQAEEIINQIISRNITFISQQQLESLYSNDSSVFKKLFSPWTDSVLDILQNLADLLVELRDLLGRTSQQEKLTLSMLYSCYQLMNQLIGYYSKENRSQDFETLKKLYRELSDLAGISFEGEPLEGLQIMGVLESRLLDFDHVIITSMNEGIFPSGKGGNSFIPLDVKREKGLPTFKEKDAIYTYHFYHLLTRAKNVYLIYNTENDGLGAGEKSRFLTQLEIDKRPNHTITKEIRYAEVPVIATKPMIVEKTDSVLERLKEIANSGFSPSSLATYIDNPFTFYIRKVLRIREVDDVEENIALNTLGTIIHGTLEDLYKPFLDKILTVEDLNSCLEKLDAEVHKQFLEIYKDGEIKRGRNLLAYEVAKRHVRNFLYLEMKQIKDGDEIRILALEHNCSKILEDPRLPYPVKIGGNVDRIEIRNGTLRITDYKTGKVEAKNMELTEFDLLLEDSKLSKVLQVLAYAFMYQDQINSRELEVGIVSFKNLKAGFLPFHIDKEKNTLITPEILANYTEILVKLIAGILNKEIPFTEKV